jgi:hypothetical protein
MDDEAVSELEQPLRKAGYTRAAVAAGAPVPGDQPVAIAW